jgi:hypothetical protein
LIQHLLLEKFPRHFLADLTSLASMSRLRLSEIVGRRFVVAHTPAPEPRSSDSPNKPAAAIRRD